MKPSTLRRLHRWLGLLFSPSIPASSLSGVRHTVMNPRHSDRQRHLEANVFTNFHKLGFIPDKDLRDWTLAILTGGAALAALAGLALFFVTRPRGPVRPA